MVIEWLNNNGLAITAITTIIVLIVNLLMTFVAYLQVRASYKQIKESRNLRKIDRHDEQLRDVFRIWRDSLYRPPMKGFKIYQIIDQPVIENLQKNRLFADIENHLPPKYKKDFFNKWRYYLDILQKYVQNQQEIIKNITVLIFNEKEGYSPESVYIKAIELLTNKKYYDYRTVQISEIPIILQLEFIKGETIYELGKASTKDEINKMQDQHEKISSIAKGQYENDIRNIINFEKDIKKIYEELKAGLDDLIIYTEYCNMDCEYIFPKES